MKTARDVAQRAGVSATTVSLVLNGKQPVGGPISIETQQRVLSAAKELGYRRNALVQAVVSGNHRTLGFLGRHIEYEFTARLLGGILDESRSAGYSLQIMRLQSNSLDSQAIESCLEMRLAGLITADLDSEALEYLRQEMKPHGVPIAFLDTSFRQEWGIHVVTDDARGCQLAIDHLVELGHRRIAFIGGEPGRGMARVREESYRQAMRGHGLEVLADYVQCGNWGAPIAQKCAAELLSLSPKNRPTAIFCANDEMAFGVQRAARAQGLQMPRDLSLIGFADMSIATLADPLLTTVKQPIEELGRMATRLLLDQLQNPEGAEEPVEKLLPTSLISRDSTAPPPLAS